MSGAAWLRNCYKSACVPLVTACHCAAAQVKHSNPGIQKLIFGGFGLPFGLAMIVICGGELYTSNAAFMPAAMYEARRVVPFLATL